MAFFEIREMILPELMDFSLDLAAREGWNPGVTSATFLPSWGCLEAECFYLADPAGFFIGLLDGEPIGCISAVSYEGAFGFIGLYIVAPPYRGQGYGLAMWQHAMRYLGGHNIGLDGVVAQQENYRKSGFQLAHRNVRYAGKSQSSVRDRCAAIVRATEVPFAQLAAYDRLHFPARRDRFLETWVRLNGGASAVYLNGETLSGFGVVRPCRQGYKIGPLFADTPEIAEALFEQLSAQLPPGTELYLDVPEPNTAAVELARRHGMEPAFETARMYTGNDPGLPLDRIFGITTFELG